jgi:hypothetical protein
MMLAVTPSIFRWPFRRYPNAPPPLPKKPFQGRIILIPAVIAATGLCLALLLAYTETTKFVSIVSQFFWDIGPMIFLFLYVGMVWTGWQKLKSEMRLAK